MTLISRSRPGFAVAFYLIFSPAIVRDPKNDYGEDWLGKHYKEHHPSMEQAMENARRAALREH